MEEGTPMEGGIQNGPEIQIVTSPHLIAPSCDLLSREARDQYLVICLPLYQAALKGDWKAANGVIEIFPTGVRSSITKGVGNCTSHCSSREAHSLCGGVGGTEES
ncbi:hypothetical protein CsSME_00031890 [Camellia sinensis var. sinensis]